MGSSTSRPETTTIIPSPSCLPNPRYSTTNLLTAGLPPSSLHASSSSSTSITPPATQKPQSILPNIVPKSSSSRTIPDSTLDPATRLRRQAGLFFGGFAFVVFSTLITRRRLAARYKAPTLTPPTLPTAQASTGISATSNAIGANSVGAGPKLATEAEAAATAAELANSGPIVALEALYLATLNVFSWGLFATGGVLWYADIASMDDLRRKVRGGMGVDGSGRSEADVEEEMEEWLASVLSRKEEKQRVRGEEDREEKGRRDRDEFEEFRRFKNERGSVR